MTSTSLLLPVFVQVLLTFAVAIAMGRARRLSLAADPGKINTRELALGHHTWSDAATQAANNFSNQFETPVLFYAGVLFALLLKQWDVVLVGLAWAFVATRIVHAVIHLGGNDVRWRAPVYILGVFCLMAFWGVLMLRVLNGTAVI